MNCVGIDVSKGKSTIAVMRPFGEVASTITTMASSSDNSLTIAGIVVSPASCAACILL